MAISGAFPTRRCTIGYGGASTSVTNHTAMGEVHDFSGPELERSMAEVTHLNSDDGFREFVPGWIDPGSIEFTCNYVPGNAAQITFLATTTGTAITNVTTSFPMQYNAAPTYWSITFSDGAATSSFSNIVFGGHWQGWSWSIPFDDRVTARGRIKLTGMHTLTTAA